MVEVPAWVVIVTILSVTFNIVGITLSILAGQAQRDWQDQLYGRK